MYATDNLGQNLTCFPRPALSDITKEDFLVLCVLLCLYVFMCYVFVCVCVHLCTRSSCVVNIHSELSLSNCNSAWPFCLQ